MLGLTFCIFVNLTFITKTRIPTYISSETQKRDIGKKFNIEQCHKINMKDDKYGKSKNL